MKTLVFFIYFLLTTVHLIAYDNFNFRSFDIYKGLSSSHSTSIIVDNSRGMLWIGTVFGLNSYNGNEMRNYFHKNEEPFSLPSSYIIYLAEDNHNNIWVSTLNGLTRYNNAKNNFIPPITGQQILSYCFYSAEQGILFGGKGELHEYNYKDKIFRKLPLDGITTDISNISEWTKGVFLLVTSSGEIKEYHYDTGKLTSSVFPTQYSSIADIYVDKRHNLYVVTYLGLLVYDKNGKLKAHISTNNSSLTHNAILDLEAKGEELWIATDGGGINIMDMSSFAIIANIFHTPGDENSIPSNSISCLYKDKQENIWAGSVRDGVFEIKKTFIQTYRNAPMRERYGLSNQSVISLCQDKKGMFWLGTDGGGVNRFNPENKTFTHYPLTTNEKVISVVDYSPTELLMMLYLKGLHLFNKQTGQYTPFNAPFSKENIYPARFYKATDEWLLMLSNRPCLYNIKTKEYHILKLQQQSGTLFYASLAGVTDDFLYLMDRNNLLKIDLKKTELSLLQTFSPDEITQVASYDPKGFFWIGTDRGLRRYDPANNKYEKIQTNLFSRVVSLIPEDGNRLWINAQNSLFSYDLENKIFFVWDESDGFSRNELTTNFPLTHNKYIYLGGLNGFVQIDKSIKNISPKKTTLRLTDIILDGVSILDGYNNQSISGQLSIPWNYKLLQLKIADIADNIFEKKLFKYSILKKTIAKDEETVIETYNPVISLDMLPPGEYYIQTSIYTKAGTWSAPQQMLHLYVTTPWYKDFRIIMGIIILILAISIWRLWIYIQRKKKKMKWEMDEIARNIDKEKLQFLMNISHELRTPLTLIYAPLKGILAKVCSKSLNTEDMEFLQKQLTTVHRSANQMKTIINMTLDVNRISEKGNKPCIRPHMINEWIKIIVSEFEYEFKNRAIEIIYLLDERITSVNFDDSKSESILSNLLMNALKFSEENSTITIASKLTADSVRISVSDEGIGLGNIAPEQLFVRFYQGEHHRQGSGIGLYYSKILINQQGGTIGACNNPDKGATFYFEFPLQNSISPEAASFEMPVTELSGLSYPEPAEIKSFDEHSLSGNYSVVLVEDNIELLKYLMETFKQKFPIVYTATNGEEAWQLICEKMPDIVVSDVMMPLKGGYELCRQIKREMQTCHIPVILLTARSDRDSTMAGYQLGADAYIPKPFESDFLFVVACNLLRNREIMKQKYRETFVRFTEKDKNEPITNRDEEFLSKMNKLILENLSSSELSVKYITEQIGMSRTVLYAKLKALANIGVNDYINQIRIEKASQLLLNTELTIAEISDSVGFEYQKYFSTLFKQIKGMPPSQYRQEKTKR